MNLSPRSYDRALAETSLGTPDACFEEKYLAIRQLVALAREAPGELDTGTVRLVADLFRDPAIAGQSQSYFFFREAAQVLACLMTAPGGNGLRGQAFQELRAAVLKTGGQAFRAASEALGSLPLALNGPSVPSPTSGPIPAADLPDFLERTGLAMAGPFRREGRSLAAALGHSGSLLVVKTAPGGTGAGPLWTEAAWMEALEPLAQGLPVRFDLPVPIPLDGSPVFSLLHEKGASPAMAFSAPGDYFRYFNHPPGEGRVTREAFREILTRNAWLMGHLASRGAIHTAPIPLFHNRVQQERREDRGLYAWQRRGRLDRWLESCRFPNLGPTGLRDFEHFLCVRGDGRSLYPYLGTHLLSLCLLAGSFFRNRAPYRKGLAPDGRPADTRDLFDPTFFETLLTDVFSAYYEGFVGEAFAEIPLMDVPGLTGRMIEEMGVDRHMEEILRAQDQERMSEAVFSAFLLERGLSREGLPGIVKGARDIVIHTGPHLGGFNQRMSLPELLDAVGTLAALCVSGRYWKEHPEG